jgi:hypothetical protein
MHFRFDLPLGPCPAVEQQMSKAHLVVLVLTLVKIVIVIIETIIKIR